VNDVRPGRTVEVPIVRIDRGRVQRGFDRVTTEEPLEIRLIGGGTAETLAVTMRTPGNDFELAAGFVRGEGIVEAKSQLANISYCIDPEIDPEQRYNIVNVELRAHDPVDRKRFERHFTITSSCGVCGRAQLDALRDRGVSPLDDDIRVHVSTLYDLPERMRRAQIVFEATGGLHAASLFDDVGTVIAVREDVGRHNAVDKLTGWALMEGRDLAHTILCVSGRTSYEIVQKAAVARIPIVCAVSAPSSLAVDLAREFNITLAGFVRGERANVYSVAERIDGANPA
jgi:FdhD protein